MASESSAVESTSVTASGRSRAAAPALHWHAYWWAGEQLPDDTDRDDPAVAAPPKTPSEWFRKPHVLHRGNYALPETALEWLAGRLLFEVPHPHAPYAVSGLIETAERRLDGHQDVTWQYRSRRDRVVMAAMLTCPRPGYRCPQDSALPEPLRHERRRFPQSPAPVERPGRGPAPPGGEASAELPHGRREFPHDHRT